VTTVKPDRKPLIFAIIGFIISWIAVWVWLFWPIGIIVWIGVLIYLIVKRKHLVWYIFLSGWIGLPAASFVRGVTHYAFGDAKLRGIGGPEVYHGVDRDTRVPVTSSGCIPIGFEAFVFPANNAAVRMCTNAFGYQTGSYGDEFPTREDALAMLQNADTIDVKLTGKYFEFETSSDVIQVDSLSFERLSIYSGQPLRRVAAVSVSENCFLFSNVNSETEEPSLFLVDVKNKSILTGGYNFD
jgi:hypothetical protein